MAAMVANPCLLTFVSCHIVDTLVKNLQFLNVNDNFSSMTKITACIWARDNVNVEICALGLDVLLVVVTVNKC